jgi:L-seryl-tRNA(Ser) seleniumtransferase
MDKKQELLRNLPGVDILLNDPELKILSEDYGQELVTYCIRRVLDNTRKLVLETGDLPGTQQMITDITRMASDIYGNSLKPMINATGIVIHTNLGRAPLGENVIEDVKDIATSYCNLEYDLKKAYRGQRNSHVVELLKFLTKAEDAIVVNNNAAAIILILSTFANDKEVVVSRGELIEIGGSFRIPEIMAAAGSNMVEVGTTNKTHLADYEKVINKDTALLFKAHKSNFALQGFTTEVGIRDLSVLGKKNGVPVVYDIGSGLLKKPKGLKLENEPDVKQAITEGADLVTFSGDKLLGGPQAGIIVGKKEYIQKLAKAPMMRALRVGKLTLAALLSACKSYLDDKALVERNPIFKMLEQKPVDLKARALAFQEQLKACGVLSKIVDSSGQCGGGTLPDLKVDSFAVVLDLDLKSKKDRSVFAERVFQELLELPKPILGILRQGALVFDVLTIFDQDISDISMQISKIIKKLDG